ncbi:MAG: hypothetical protein U0359_22280 [Byssovorax sp.]
MSWATCAFRRADFFIGFSFHEAMFPPLPPIPYYPHISFGIVSGSTQLFSLPSCGNHKQISSNGLHLMGRMSDAFPIVPHLSYPPQWGLVMTTLFGSSNMVWGSGSVELKCFTVFASHGQAADISSALGYCVSPHLSCNEPLSFLMDIACVTDSTTMVGISLGDFLASLIDIAIQLAMELGMKALFAGFKTLKGRLTSSKKILKTDKFVKFSEAFDAVQAKTQVDDLVKNGWSFNEAAEAATSKVKKAGEAAEESGVYKYGKKQMTAKKNALETIDNAANVKTTYDEMLKNGKITDDAYKNMMKMNDEDVVIAKYKYAKASSKLDEIDDAWYTTWAKELNKSLSKTGDDALITSLDSAGTWKAWHNAYLDGSKNWFYKLIGCYDATNLFLQAWTKTGDSWYQKMLYPLARRLTARMGTLASKFYSAGTTGSYASEDSTIWSLWGNRQDLIDELNGFSATSTTEADDSSASYDRFGWVDETVGSTGTKTRFGRTTSLTAGTKDQWADESFNASSQSRFTWVPADDDDSESDTDAT